MHRERNRYRFFLAAAVFLAAVFPHFARGDELLQESLDLRAKYAAEIERLSAWCDERGLAEEARKTRRILGPNDPLKLYVPVLPEEIGPPRLPADSPENVVEWDAKLRQLRRTYAVSCFNLARRAVRAGRGGLAFELALASIGANPDYEPVRRLFGYQKYGDRWRTIYEIGKLRSGAVWSDKFGWIPKSRLCKYESGQRYLTGKWISAAEDAERHADIRSGWNVTTEHFSIRTNHSIEAAVTLGVKLERLHHIWQQLFLRYYSSQADVAALFDGRSRPGAADAPRLNVVLFRDREDYNRYFRASTPNIGISTGVYFGKKRRAYFFVGPECDERTMYHEATHQLFYESRRVSPHAGLYSNFWIIEGIAMFMESLRQEGGYHVLGGLDDERIHAAKRLLNDGFYVPLSEMVELGMDEFQQGELISKFYSQSAGLTNFLIFYDGGRYRDAVVSYLSAVYSGRADRGTLSQLTGVNYTELDKQYREYLKGKDAKSDSPAEY
ncbi:MAG: DUF1570 domain-containing protein [Pirellulales bacterium]|nr:DUF1570 domain-containing protein [Pirellulales bacterium]